MENFEGSKGIVRTASVDQVRSGIQNKEARLAQLCEISHDDLKLDDETFQSLTFSFWIDNKSRSSSK